jgi:4,5-DOPA dioxygenase extradiol
MGTATKQTPAPPTLDDAQSLPKPRGIVVISARWENAPLAVTHINAATPLDYI